MLMKILAIVFILLGAFLALATHDMHLRVGFYAPHPIHVTSGIIILLIGLWMAKKAFRSISSAKK